LYFKNKAPAAQSTWKIVFRYLKVNPLNNQSQQGSNEAPKAPTPSETKPTPQQNQGDGKPTSPEPDQRS
jgi:hypothetical protein